jgi:multidrug efflux system membrane fusion protein
VNIPIAFGKKIVYYLFDLVGFFSTQRGLNMTRQFTFKTIESMFLLALLAAATVFEGCARKKEAVMPPVPVMTGRVTSQAVPLILNAVGTVESIESVLLRPQVNGIITRVAFSEGQDVREGQLLFQIDPRPFQAALDAASAQLAKDKAQAENAEVQAKRYADLSEKDYATKEQYDTYRTQAEVFRSVVKADEAAQRQAELNLAYASISAPISGRTGTLLAKKGNVVRANTDILVAINQLRPIRVSFSIPENKLSLLRKYSAQRRLEVNVRQTGTADDLAIKGLLVFMDNEVDPATGTVTLKAEFSNEAGLLWPGQFADVDLILDVESGAITVPAGAVVTGQDGTFVFVVGQDKKVEKRTVKLNRTLDDTAVIDEGLKEGETVVTDGQMRLVPGAVVAVKSGTPEKGKNP